MAKSMTGRTLVVTAGGPSCPIPSTSRTRSDKRAAPPPEFDLRRRCTRFLTSFSLNSCTANAVAAAMEYERDRQGLSNFVPSRLFMYYNTRALEGTILSNEADLGGGLAVMRSFLECLRW
jgi:C1A family cysteine protease